MNGSFKTGNTVRLRGHPSEKFMKPENRTGEMSYARPYYEPVYGDSKAEWQVIFPRGWILTAWFGLHKLEPAGQKQGIESGKQELYCLWQNTVLLPERVYKPGQLKPMVQKMSIISDEEYFTSEAEYMDFTRLTSGKAVWLYMALLHRKRRNIKRCRPPERNCPVKEPGDIKNELNIKTQIIKHAMCALSAECNSVLCRITGLRLNKISTYYQIKHFAYGMKYKQSVKVNYKFSQEPDYRGCGYLRARLSRQRVYRKHKKSEIRITNFKHSNSNEH